MYIVLLGPPGAGKGTQALRIAAATKLLHVSTGDMFRENVKNETELGKLAKTFMEKGELVPDEVTIRMLLDRIGRPDAAAGVMFDGFPRNVVQAKALDDALATRGGKIDRALLINVRDEELVRRLSARFAETGREDDRPDVVASRLQKQKPAADLVQHYRDAGALREIDGERTLDPITHDLLEALKGA